ncbi:TetR/AcrR family transcriptional regulator [Paracoccus aurantiacus]|uniref:TetR/AcrR family transcriptional regulator n=2 Tax=Paracoccus aurantiacus TaxID=2599412 RepID=A0A5C6RYS3_9RHOB|nr:TetR/AcrR family transcriptional regulator [Paracoccus aurantiacus]TXB67421.1 TetR/AcrR family transcriptional regulator [Paracoccus aurantiacus]
MAFIRSSPQERRAARRRHVLQSARLGFQENGFHATSMDDIIRASGLSAGAVYGYFKGKDELILAAADASMMELREEIAPLLRNPVQSPGDFLKRVKKAIDSVSDRGPIDLRRMAVLGWAEAQCNEALRQRLSSHYGDLLARMTDIVEACQERRIETNADAIETGKLMLSVLFGTFAQASIWADEADTSIFSALEDNI